MSQASTTTSGYTADSFHHSGGLDVVRENPTMYMGDLGEQMVFTMLRELTDNGRDEALAGRCRTIAVFMAADNVFYAVDNGLGFPFGDTNVVDAINNKKVRLPALQVATGFLHAGAKSKKAQEAAQASGSKAYKNSVGVHGIGMKGTNALSVEFDVWSFHRDSKRWHSVHYSKGKLKSYNPKAKPPLIPWSTTGQVMQGGTIIRFKPDVSVVEAETFPHTMYESYAQIASYFTPGTNFLLMRETDKGITRQEWVSAGGPRDYVSQRLKELNVAESEATVVEFSNETAQVVLAFTNYKNPSIGVFTNGLPNRGGSHHDSLINALFDAACEVRNSRQKFEVSDVKIGLVGLVNAVLENPKFAGQTKERLADPRAGAVLRGALKATFLETFQANKALATRLCERWQRLYELRTKFENSRETDKAIKARLGQGFNPKAAMSLNCTPAQREIYFAEGDSAAGQGKQARNVAFQEVLGLRGKMSNAARQTNDEAGVAAIVSSKSTLDILAQIGYDPSKPDPYEHLRMSKIILLVDPDPDGDHIALLAMGLVLRLVPELITRGMVYILEPAEYWSLYKGVPYFGGTVKDVRDQLAEAGAPDNFTVRHLKGWGELDVEWLSHAAFNPATRRLRQITVDGEDSVSRFFAIMGRDPAERKRILGI